MSLTDTPTAPARVRALRLDSFAAATASADTPVLVDFWAPWCGPCRMVAPILEGLADAYGERLQIAKLNVDEAPEIAARFGVRSIPTLVLFKNGQPLQQIVGAQSAEALKAWLAPAL
jgi:thioredoxin 1